MMQVVSVEKGICVISILGITTEFSAVKVVKVDTFKQLCRPIKAPNARI